MSVGYNQLRHPFHRYAATLWKVMPPQLQHHFATELEPGGGLKHIVRAEGVLWDSKLLITSFLRE